MTEGFCRITVVSPRRKVDLTLPADLACAELLPEVVRLSGESDQGPPPLDWRLGRLGEPPLRPERTLAQSGVYDGDLLYLRAGRWRASTWHRFAMAAAGTLLAAAAAALAGAGGRGRAELAGAAGGAAVGLCLAALGLGRRLGQPVAAA